MNTEEENYTLAQIIEQHFDLSEYTPEEKESMIEETTTMIMESTMLRLVNEASDEVQEKFGELIKSNPDEQTMITFVTTHFPHFNKVLIDEVNILKSIGEEETTTEE